MSQSIGLAYNVKNILLNQRQAHTTLKHQYNNNPRAYQDARSNRPRIGKNTKLDGINITKIIDNKDDRLYFQQTAQSALMHRTL